MNDKSWSDYQKLKNKYPYDFSDFLDSLKSLYYYELPLYDKFGNNLVFIKDHTKTNTNACKNYLSFQIGNYNAQTVENEILSTSSIENIDFKRESVRKILHGNEPSDNDEKRIEGLKKGFEFISNPTNAITEANIFKLYMMTIGSYLDESDRPSNNSFYRNDIVYVVGSTNVEHAGFNSKVVPSCMSNLVAYINSKDSIIDDLLKACIIHFYVAYVHPWFDGNGRMARLMHLWYLIQNGYQSALFLPFSQYIKKSRNEYNRAYNLIEKNYFFSGVIDVTPFLEYINTYVYSNIALIQNKDSIKAYRYILEHKSITEKEASLWKFVISHFGTEEFSTKQLEKAYGNAAYATIRSFVIKFSELNLLEVIPYTTKNKYRVKN